MIQVGSRARVALAKAAGLIPVVKTIQRNGKSIQVTYWVRPKDAAHAQAGDATFITDAERAPGYKPKSANGEAAHAAGMVAWKERWIFETVAPDGTVVKKSVTVMVFRSAEGEPASPPASALPPASSTPSKPPEPPGGSPAATPSAPAPLSPEERLRNHDRDFPLVVSDPAPSSLPTTGTGGVARFDQTMLSSPSAPDDDEVKEFFSVNESRFIDLAKNVGALSNTASDGVHKLTVLTPDEAVARYGPSVRDTPGLFDKGDLVLSTSSARQLAIALATGEVSDFHQANAVSLVLHETFHAASNRNYAYEGAKLIGSGAPVAAMEEATTEILAQHYFKRFTEQLGVQINPRAYGGFAIRSGPLFAEVPVSMDGKDRVVIDGTRIVGYNKSVNAFARMVSYVDDVSIGQLGADAFERHVAGRALQAKRLSDQSSDPAMPKLERYGMFARPILDRHKVSPDHPRYQEITQAIRSTLGDFLEGRGKLQGQRQHTLDDEIKAIIDPGVP